MADENIPESTAEPDEASEVTEAVTEERPSHPGAHHNHLLLEWHTPEYINHPKTKTWYMVAGIIMVSLIAYALYTNSATMAIVFIVLTGVYTLTHNRNPRIIYIKLTELGIYVDEIFHPYNTINSFWIVYHPPYVSTLNLKLGDRSGTHLSIQLNQQNPVEVREILSREIPEMEGQQENMMDILIRLLRL